MSNRTLLSVGGVNPEGISTSNSRLTSYNVVSGADSWTIELNSLGYQTGAFGTSSRVVSDIDATFDTRKAGIHVPPSTFGTISTNWKRKSSRVSCTKYMC